MTLKGHYAMTTQNIKVHVKLLSVNYFVSKWLYQIVGHDKAKHAVGAWDTCTTQSPALYF